MKLLGKQLTKSEQDQVLQESYEPGCVISELAKEASPILIYMNETLC